MYAYTYTYIHSYTCRIGMLENIIAVHMTQLKDSEIDRLAEVNACIHTYIHTHTCMYTYKGK